MEDREISRAVIGRLPRYYRFLGELLDEDVERISSSDLSKKMRVTASQIRQDLNNFGGFGQQGYGYNVKYLYTEIGKILGLDHTHNIIIVGAGNLGQALANYMGFEKSGFILKGLFDVNPRLEGVAIRGIPIRRIDELKDFIKHNDIEIAVLTIPKSKAEEVAEILVAGGIHGIWNFAHTDLILPDNVVVESVHLSDSLLELSYNISSLEKGKGNN
ncbi:redox-sensing transcriptional repressor Rex [Clostridium sp. C105KSO13]|uniref:redox-sensing transcriptional repressor Rex n=1 Tax=Clostridium sp. C105KSO13 TaxID=1776045 RepID=UPI0007407E3F|nr:redox-sensing transcriptional repressor Rex [Clostridium sp. C105KSO13]CUX50032.1 Redox-sensing transcriptional repressor Rex [Clostridium sp. C105KSO13]